MQHFFVGVDGGASKTIVRIENIHGELVGEKITGPANIRISPQQAWHSVQEGLNQILLPLGYQSENMTLKIVIGIAGCEVPAAYSAFMQYAAIFSEVWVVPDSYTACFGAHAGEDGAIIIIGTGSVGFQIDQGKISQVGGWGFPHDDEGSGAWLGLMALSHTVKTFDRREKPSGLSTAVLRWFKEDKENLITWGNQATSTQFAQLAPLVIEQMQCEDQTALGFMKKGAEAINAIAKSLIKQQRASHKLPFALIGGIAKHLQPFLDDELKSLIHKPKMTPVEGAVLLARRKG